ncbi:MAG: acyl carrier protein [Burkholderiales bacterium]
MSASTADIIRAHLADKYQVKFGGQVTDTTDLLDIGLLDSFGFVELVQHVEDTFKITFDDAELSSNALATVQGLVAAIERKTKKN